MMATKLTHQRDPYWAHIAPFAVFMCILAVPDLVETCGLGGDGLDSNAASHSGATSGWSVFKHRELWLYPLQTFVCFALLIFYRRNYCLKPWAGVPLGVIAGVVGIALWVLPGLLFQRYQIAFPLSEVLGMVDRSDGFDPGSELAQHPPAIVWFWMTRLLRLIVVVPIMEEVFWRSFLMRFLADSKQEFDQAKFGQHSGVALLVVTSLFVAAHQPVDYFGATCFGLLAYWVTVRTKSLVAVIAMHSVANACLAAYVVASGQWGYL
ncbi:MAG: CAAX prenyl protease-related protein [Fuerstiella sp.]